MQIASKQCVWNEGGSGTVVEVEMTEATGLYLRFVYGLDRDTVAVFSWGDGTVSEIPYVSGEMYADHTYPKYGKFKIRMKNVRSIGFRTLDGQSQYNYDAAILSLVDYSGHMTGSRSGAFKRCVNLKKFIAPNATCMGQRDFAYCTSLEEVKIGNCGIYYDGTFQYCSKLKKFETGRSWTCWSYVWEGCTSLAELKLGDVNQFATRDFSNTPLLKDIWIANKTVDQIKQVAASGNIVAGYGARFPWGACAGCRFHGTDGIVLGNGTRIS